jgi:NarL family two-component system response regulator LiaR
LLDLDMPWPTLAQLEKNILTSFPAMVTLVWTAHHRDAYHTSMMDAGVAGVLPKTETAEGLISAIRQAISGNSLFTHEQFTRGNHWRQKAGVKWAALTSRERQVLRLLTLEGCDNKCIAKTLGITAKTAAYHVTNILKKTGCEIT